MPKTQSVSIPFVGPSYVTEAKSWSAQECINWFPDQAEAEAKTPIALMPTPGTELLVQVSAGTKIRGMITGKDGNLYVVAGTGFYKVEPDLTVTLIPPSIPGTDEVSMAQNGVQVVVSNGSLEGWLLDMAAGTMEPISDPDFPGAGSFTFQDGYFIFNEPDTEKWYVSNLVGSVSGYDFNSALDFTSANSSPDNIVRVISDHGEVWVLGQTSTEVYTNTGNADFPFERILGANIQVGIGAKNSVSKVDNTLVWYTNQNTIVRAQGYQPVIISTEAVSHEIQSYARQDDAIGYHYYEAGKAFYILTFPTGGATWAYDFSTKLWHKRARYNLPRHNSNCLAVWENKNVIGDYANGNLYVMKLGIYKDDTYPIQRTRITPPIYNQDKRVTMSRLQVDFEMGQGLLPTQQGDNPQAMIQWSDDGGYTWSNENWRSMGKIGQYSKRAIWRRLGTFRQRCFRLIVSDPVLAVVTGATGFMAGHDE